MWKCKECGKTQIVEEVYSIQHFKLDKGTERGELVARGGIGVEGVSNRKFLCKYCGKNCFNVIEEIAVWEDDK